jgi:Plasmid pRiA4b ORF-3-like protein
MPPRSGDPGVVYPRLIEATGRCPPEDIGGPWGYAEFLNAIRDPKHERHVELKEWIAYDFDPNIVDTEGLAEEVAALAKRWSPNRPGGTNHPEPSEALLRGALYARKPRCSPDGHKLTLPPSLRLCRSE